MTEPKFPPRGYFVCECNDMDCHIPLDITPQEYDAILNPCIARTCKTPRMGNYDKNGRVG